MRRTSRPSSWLLLLLAVVLLGCDGAPSLPSFGGPSAGPPAGEVATAPEPAAGPEPTVPPQATTPTVLEDDSSTAAETAPLPSRPAVAPRPTVASTVESRGEAPPPSRTASVEEEDEEGEAVEPPPRQPTRGFVLPAPAPATSDSAIRSGEIIIGGVRAARIFAGPQQYPPNAFAAYGILAFPSRAAAADKARHVMLCEAYVAALPHTNELSMPIDKQMVTVWPVNADKIADDLNAEAGSGVCERAIRNYHLPVALQAIREAGPDHFDRAARGPFLLAWSPASTKGDPTAPVLMADLSDVTTYEQARAIFVLWRTDIEANPEYWEDGWSLEQLRLSIRLWVDRVGPQIFSILGA